MLAFHSQGSLFTRIYFFNVCKDEKFLLRANVCLCAANSNVSKIPPKDYWKYLAKHGRCNFMNYRHFLVTWEHTQSVAKYDFRVIFAQPNTGKIDSYCLIYGQIFLPQIFQQKLKLKQFISTNKYRNSRWMFRNHNECFNHMAILPHLIGSLNFSCHKERNHCKTSTIKWSFGLDVWIDLRASDTKDSD